MRTAARRDDDPVSFMKSMGFVALASFVVGFAGYMVFGLL
jgi:hypothetical protein